MDPAFQHRGSGGHLPSGDALVQGPFEQRADHGRPREANADFGAGQAGGEQVSRADAGGGHENAGKYESGSETHRESRFRASESQQAVPDRGQLNKVAHGARQAKNAGLRRNGA